jgi:hypothetical protein
VSIQQMHSDPEHPRSPVSGLYSNDILSRGHSSGSAVVATASRLLTVRVLNKHAAKPAYETSAPS